MSENVTDVSYSQGEEELGKIENELSTITTSSDFFEQEKIRQKQKKEADKAQDIRDALAVGEAVSTRDKNWLAKYEEALNAPAVVLTAEEQVTAEIESTEVSETTEANDFIVSSEEGLAAQAVADFDDEEESESDELPFYDEADSEPESHV
jgi:segregation and condensation protein B